MKAYFFFLQSLPWRPHGAPGNKTHKCVVLFPPLSSGVLSFTSPPLASSVCQLLSMWFYQLLALGRFCPRKAVKLKKQLFCPFLLRVFCWSMFTYISVQFSRSVVSDSLWPHGLQHTRLPFASSTPRACSNSCPSGQWCHPTISSAVVPLSSCLQSFPASGSFPESQFYACCDPYKGFGIVNKAEIDVFLELSCFFDDPAGVGNLKEMGIPDHLTCLLNLYAGQEATVRTVYGTTNWF